MNQTDNGCPGSRNSPEERVSGTSPGSKDARLTRAVEEYLAALEAGAAPDRRAFLDRYPDIVGPLAECLDGLEFVNSAAAELQAPVSAPDLQAPTDSIDRNETLGDFRIVREIGRGGMGVVYEAEQRSLGRRVALKVLPFAAMMDPRHLQRFHNEARAAASLHHEHIVPIYAVGCERSVHYYAMQFVEGQTLASLIAQQRRQVQAGAGQKPTTSSKLPAANPTAPTSAGMASPTQPAPQNKDYFRRVAEWGIEAAEALDHAHSLGIVHRDIKPGNLMLDVAGKVWVTDFGLARTQADAGLTMTGDLLGTLRYMSPEQALAKRLVVDHRTDVYSLGATLYELLTLEPVLTGIDREELLRQIAFEEPRPPRRLNKAIPGELEIIVLKALAKEPPDRYATAQEMADDLRRFLEDRPIRALRPSWLQRARRWFRRHQAIVTTTAMTLAVTLSIATVFIWRERDGTLQALHDAKDQRERAEERELLARRQLYAAHIAAAQRAWMVADLGIVKGLLEQHIPRPGEEDLRGFEWYYLWGLLQGRKEPLRTLRGHKGEVYCAQFSPDGKLLATAGQDRTIRLWDPATGEARAVLRGHNHEVNWVAFAPEGGLLASAGDDGEVKLWDLASARETCQILKGSVQVVGVAFSPDGKLLAAGLHDGTVHWWDRPSGRERPPFRAQEGRIESVLFSPDSRTLATSKESVSLWNAATGKLQQILPGSGPKAMFVRFSHRGDVVAAPSWISRLQLWDAASGNRLLYLANPRGAIESAAFSPDDRVLATAEADGKVRLWHARSGQMLDLLALNTGRVWCVDFSPDGRTLATAGEDGVVRLWDPEARQNRRVLASSPRRCRLAFSSDGKRLVGAGIRKNEGGLSIWEVPSGRLAASGETLHPIDALALCPDGTTVATGHQGGLVTVWGLNDGRPRLTFEADRENVYRLTFTADGKTLLTNGSNNIVRQWDVPTGRLRRDITPAHIAHVELVYSPATNLVATIRAEGIDLWGFAAVHSPFLPWPTKSYGYGVSAFSPDGALLASWIDSSVFLWDVASRRILFSLAGHRNQLETMTFSPDGRTLASLSADGEVKFWSVLTGQEMLSLEDHRGPIRSITFAPNGRMLATSCAVEGGEEEVHLWLTPEGPQVGEPSSSDANGTGR